LSGVIKMTVNLIPSALRLSIRMSRKLRNNSVDTSELLPRNVAVGGDDLEVVQGPARATELAKMRDRTFG
jgi:hypothetical protein